MMLLWLAVVLIIMGAFGFIGLQIRSAPFPPHPEGTKDRGKVPIPDDVPEPVRRYFRALAGGDEVPDTATAVSWARARIRMNGIPMNLRFKLYHDRGRNFRRDMDVTVFGFLPILHGTDLYSNGQGSMTIAGNTESGPKIDQGALVSVWAEVLVMLPSAILNAPNIRWEPVDDHRAKMIIEWKNGEEVLDLHFDPETGLFRKLTVPRYKGMESEKVLWHVTVGNWKRVDKGAFGSMMVAQNWDVKWEDEDRPWFIVRGIDGIEWNVDVTDAFPEVFLNASGPRRA
jgi:hypothetical protein